MKGSRVGPLVTVAVVGTCVASVGLGFDALIFARGNSAVEAVLSLVFLGIAVGSALAWREVYKRTRGESDRGLPGMLPYWPSRKVALAMLFGGGALLLIGAGAVISATIDDKLAVALISAILITVGAWGVLAAVTSLKRQGSERR